MNQGGKTGQMLTDWIFSEAQSPLALSYLSLDKTTSGRNASGTKYVATPATGCLSVQTDILSSFGPQNFGPIKLQSSFANQYEAGTVEGPLTHVWESNVAAKTAYGAVAWRLMHLIRKC